MRLTQPERGAGAPDAEHEARLAAAGEQALARPADPDHARAGRRGRALRQYLECRRALVDAFGIEPGEESVALQRRILAAAAE